MMKRKGGPTGDGGKGGGRRRGLFRRTVSRKWVTRYFILHRDGRLVYYKDRPSLNIINGSASVSSSDDKNCTIFCRNVTECDIEQVTPSNIEHDSTNHVANSLYVTNKSTGAKTLLVANGPDEYTRWIVSFRKLKASISKAAEEVAMAVKGHSAANASATTAAAIDNGGEENATVKSDEAVSVAKAVGENNSSVAGATLVAASVAKKEAETETKKLEEERRLEKDASATIAAAIDNGGENNDTAKSDKAVSVAAAVGENTSSGAGAAALAAAAVAKKEAGRAAEKLEEERRLEKERLAASAAADQSAHEEWEESRGTLENERLATLAAAAAAEQAAQEKWEEEEKRRLERDRLAAAAAAEQAALEEEENRLWNEKLAAAAAAVERLSASASAAGERQRVDELERVKGERLAREEQESIVTVKEKEEKERQRRQREEEETDNARLLEEEAKTAAAAAKAASERARSPEKEKEHKGQSEKEMPKIESSESTPPPQSNEPKIAAAEEILSVESLKDSRRKELQKVMRDRSLEKEERKSKMDEIKERFDRLIEEAEALEEAEECDIGDIVIMESDDQDTGEGTDDNTRMDNVKQEETSNEGEVASIEKILNDSGEPTGHGDRMHWVHTGKDGKKLVEKAAAVEEQQGCYEKAIANQAVITDMIDDFAKMTEFEISMAAKVFACGCTFDELKKSLVGDSAKKVLFGILVTSLREMTNDYSEPDATEEKDEKSSLAAFSLEYEGGNADSMEVKKFKGHLDVIGSFCKKNVSFDEIHHVAYSAAGDARSQILEQLGAPESNGERNREGKSPQPTEESNSKFDPSTYSDTDKTAYYRAIEVFGADNVPSGDEILQQLRQPLGFPYNWVLFEPSKKELVVKDAGSGGVMELTKLLQEEKYDDCVLFGFVRLSFSADEIGRRQFWVGLEWKGENCFGVKAMRKFRECCGPMTRMVGDRSFTLSNVAASEMRLELFVENVKRNCQVNDFKVTVETMKNAHVEEQNEIKEYWKKYEDERDAEAETKRKAEEKRLRSRREKIESVRDSHRSRWSKMGVTELLGDLGKDDVCGWVLMEF